MGTSRSELRKTIAGCRKNSRGRRSYEAELRREVVSFIDAAVRKGGNFERECQSLGIDSTVVRRWRKAERSPGFEAVRVVGSARPWPRRLRMRGLL